MTGLDRSMLCIVASTTGLRRSELEALVPQSFHLAEHPPSVICEAQHTKHGQAAVQPIPEAVAAMLCPWLACKAPGKPVFNLPEKTGQMIKADLKRAGIKTEASGEIDMHSLRHGYITMLIKSAASLAIVKKLARHSSVDLTLETYTHLAIQEEAAAVDRPPSLFGTSPNLQPEVPAEIGTEGPTTHINDSPSLPFPYGGSEGGQAEAVSVGMNTIEPTPASEPNSLIDDDLDGVYQGMSVTGGSAPRRTRTYNPLIKSQLLCQLS